MKSLKLLSDLLSKLRVVVSFRTHGAFPKVRSLPQYLGSRIDDTYTFAMAFACAKIDAPHAGGTARGLQGRVLV